MEVGEKTFSKSDHPDVKTRPVGSITQGRVVGVHFKDEEIMLGTTIEYDSKRLGFFLVPLDQESNNMRIFVVTRAVE
jgi:hypothetical protein